MAGGRRSADDARQSGVRPRRSHACDAATGRPGPARVQMNPVILQQPRRVFFGVDCAARSAEELVQANRKKIFVVSSPTAARHGKALFDSWRARGANVVVNDAVSREPE